MFRGTKPRWASLHRATHQWPASCRSLLLSPFICLQANRSKARGTLHGTFTCPSTAAASGAPELSPQTRKSLGSVMAASGHAAWPAARPVARPRLSRFLGPSTRSLAPQHRSYLAHISCWTPAPRPAGVEAPRRQLPPRRLPSPVAALPRSAVELLDAVPGKGELLTPRLDPDVRQRAEKAIELRGRRVTIGDVASTAGLRLEQAEEAVRALAADSQATLQVCSADRLDRVYWRLTAAKPTRPVARLLRLHMLLAPHSRFCH